MKTIFAIMIFLSFESFGQTLLTEAEDSFSPNIKQWRVSAGRGSEKTPEAVAVKIARSFGVRNTMSWGYVGGFISDVDLKAGFAALQGGLALVLHPNFYLNGYVGPGLISNTAGRLTGNFQFFVTASFGFVTNKNLSVGFELLHISNAHIKRPNYGRDVKLLTLGFPF